MANTERLAAIRLLREAKNAASSARFDPATPASARGALETAHGLLHRLEDSLILDEVADNVANIEKQGKELESIADDIKKAVEELEGIADKINKAAKAVGVLATIAAKAASSGLL